MILDHYTPGSAICAEYLRLNGITGLAVWSDHNGRRKVWRVVSTCDPEGSEGFPDDPHYTTRREAIARARSLSTRHSLPYHGVTL